MVQSGHETTRLRVVLALTVSICLGAFLTAIWIWFGWTLLAPRIDMAIHWLGFAVTNGRGERRECAKADDGVNGPHIAFAYTG